METLGLRFGVWKEGPGFAGLDALFECYRLPRKPRWMCHVWRAPGFPLLDLAWCVGTVRSAAFGPYTNLDIR